MRPPSAPRRSIPRVRSSAYGRVARLRLRHDGETQRRAALLNERPHVRLQLILRVARQRAAKRLR